VERPKNVLFLWTDQQRPDTIGAYANPQISTPNLDRLAATGALFESAYCAQPVCSPSRASVLTGLYPHTHGVTANNTPLPVRAITIAELLPDSYACGYVGKWHLGREHAAQRGFDDFWSSTEDYKAGYAEGDPAAVAPSDYRAFLTECGYDADTGGHAISREAAARLPEEVGKPAFQAQECRRFLDTFGGQPFFLMCNFLEPHPPVTGPLDDLYRPGEMTLPESWYREMEPTVPARFRQRRDPALYPNHYTNLPSNDELGWKTLKARYWGLATLVDRYCGAILDHLDALGLKDDTIVVYSTDHGDMMGEHRLLNKGVPYEGSARVPLIIRVPGLAPRRITTPVSQVQLVATLLELLGQPVPTHLQGESFAPLLAGQHAGPEEVVVEWNGFDGTPGDRRGPEPPEVRTIRRGQWKLNVHASGEHELYDLQADPGELHNAFSDPGSTVVRGDLFDRLLRWQRRTGDPLALQPLH